MKVVSYADIKRLVTLPSVVGPVREAFAIYSLGKANVPAVQHLEMPECNNGALHIKSGHVPPMHFCLVKVASTFPENLRRSPPSPSIGGVILVFSVTDGAPIALLQDCAWITQIRTAGAGAIAAELYARRDAETLGVIGSGVQARLQAAAVLHSCPSIRRLLVWGRTTSHVSKFLIDLRAAHPWASVDSCVSAEEVARESDVVVTATYSREPLVHGGWLREGVLVVAMGADSVHKQELHQDVIADADMVVVDSRAQNAILGEIGRGIKAGDYDLSRMDQEIGEGVAHSRTQGTAPRRRDSDRIVAKLTGVAVQEIMVCDALLREIGIRDAANG
jgi:ornithine cyclodeaminase